MQLDEQLPRVTLLVILQIDPTDRIEPGGADRSLVVAEGVQAARERGLLPGMKAAGWDATALDPDERACEHARRTVGVRAVHADFMLGGNFGRYDAIALNKVLEHVPEPVAMLRKAGQCLEPGGFVYLELPDAEGARAEGFEREEFFIEHLHVFSLASLARLAERAPGDLLDHLGGGVGHV